MTAGRSWLLLRIKNLAKAEENVRNQNTEFYAPRAMLRSERTHRLSRQPLFPGYAFARPPGPEWMFLRSTRGVLDVLLWGPEKPAEVPAREIEKLRAREGPDGLVRVEAGEFKIGERVHIEEGVLVADAIVDGMSGQDRIFVLTQAMGRWIRVEVEVSAVRRG